MVSLQAALVALALSGASQNVMLDFFSDSCGPCRAMEPTVQTLEAKGYPIQRINISQSPDLAARYQIHSVPCYVMIVDGREVDRVLGGTSLSRLERMCKLAQAAPSEPSPAALAGNGSMDATAAVPAGSTSLPVWDGTPLTAPASAMPLSAIAPSAIATVRRAAFVDSVFFPGFRIRFRITGFGPGGILGVDIRRALGVRLAGTDRRLDAANHRRFPTDRRQRPPAHRRSQRSFVRVGYDRRCSARRGAGPDLRPHLPRLGGEGPDRGRPVRSRYGADGCRAGWFRST